MSERTMTVDFVVDHLKQQLRDLNELHTTDDLCNLTKHSSSMEKHLQFSEQNLVQEEEIGHGAFGNVFLAKNITNNMKVAVKRMSNQRKEFQKYAMITENRINTLSNNRNIVPLFGYYQTDGFFHIVMPYYVNGSLKNFLDKVGSIRIESAKIRIESAKISSEILNGLVFLHMKKVVHRNLKPGNILIGENGEMRLTDIAMEEFQKRVEGKSDTLNYRAPEVIKARKLSYAVDIWSFGCIVYELLSGELAFDNKDEGSLKKMICAGAYTMHGKVPASATTIIADCLQKQPSKRPSSQDLYFHKWIAESAEESEKNRKIEAINLALGKMTIKTEKITTRNIVNMPLVRSNKPEIHDSRSENSNSADSKSTMRLRNKSRVNYKQ
ncbi:hypothetical protein GCK72_022660 [Caenorhabditis remanei]|uniref:mitogen-activated protein kinase kinase n=1 Tax=Caenorhabditis remanei TaxID=31234 RepID=A0A6A5FUE1_CAERE|nr:hypothetical protein GCK72_022660 [Caenorhabditis remanei]KAF1746207.1 hypothetical protein GCK72_022660 [Caenorhabditis remanei]